MERVSKKAAGKIVFIGGGMMSEAIIKGMIAGKVAASSAITAIDIAVERCKYLSNTYKINATSDGASALKDAQIIFLAVKPQMINLALDEKMVRNIPTNALVVSIMAGIDLKELSKRLPKRLLIRAMPNTPLAIGEGMTVLSRAAGVEDEKLDYVLNIFKACGQAIELPESQLDAVTGLSGSGPGYIFVIIDALADAGVMAGLSRDIAIRLAAQTVCGAGRMVLETGKHPAQLRDQVTSPGGTTIAGIAAMEKAAVRSGIIDAVLASMEKSRSLGR